LLLSFATPIGAFALLGVDSCFKVDFFSFPIGLGVYSFILFGWVLTIGAFVNKIM
jgi:hypothetical protein